MFSKFFLISSGLVRTNISYSGSSLAEHMVSTVLPQSSHSSVFVYIWLILAPIYEFHFSAALGTRPREPLLLFIEFRDVLFQYFRIPPVGGMEGGHTSSLVLAVFAL